MFANQRRGTAGLGSITAVALVAIGWLVGTGVMVEAYRDGVASVVPAQCQRVCQAHAMP